jgi:hypothetical protein
MTFEWPRTPRNDDRPWRLFEQFKENDKARMRTTIAVKRCQGCPNSIRDPRHGVFCRVWKDDRPGFERLNPDEVNIPDFCRLPLYEVVTTAARDGGMRISARLFVHGGEVDYLSSFAHQGRTGRVSMRKNGRRYELYVHWRQSWTGLGMDETILFESESLEEAVGQANAWVRKYADWPDRTDDEYVEEEQVLA